MARTISTERRSVHQEVTEIVTTHRDPVPVKPLSQCMLAVYLHTNIIGTNIYIADGFDCL